MSRAERRELPAPPRVGRVLREAVSDLYYNSFRFLGANMLLGVTLIAILLASVGSAWLLALLPLAAVPAAGTMRMATCMVRRRHADFGDFTEIVRSPGAVLALGLAQGVVTLVLVVDLWLGGAIGGWLGVLLSVSAVYGLLIGWAYAAVAWTLVLDPERDDDPISARLRLAAMILVAHPIRVGGYLLVVGLVLALSGLAIAPILTFTVALAWLAIAHFVLPVADRIEGRPTRVIEPD
ncbi:MAG TPA: hypothetical protein VLA76_11360 [Candidatus Angelobacter sp.]|nr:hypothetical protein [Candidatus Angelobacter sp.]